MVYFNLGTFKACMEKKGIKNKSFIARNIGVDRSYICKLEKGDITPSAEKMLRLARLLECKVEDLFQYVNKG